MVDSRADSVTVYGSRMNHAAFGMQINRGDVSGTTLTSRFGLAGSDSTGSRPAGTATWRGLMVGTPATGSAKGNGLEGDAALACSMSSQSLNAAFTSIKNIDTLRSHATTSVRSAGVPVATRRTFNAGNTGNCIDGGF